MKADVRVWRAWYHMQLFLLYGCVKYMVVTMVYLFLRNH